MNDSTELQDGNTIEEISCWQTPCTVVIVVDDDRDVCQLLNMCLTRGTMNVQFAHNGRLGLKLPLSGQDDLVVLEVMLPQLTGAQMLKELRSNSPNRCVDADCVG